MVYSFPKFFQISPKSSTTKLFSKLGYILLVILHGTLFEENTKIIFLDTRDFSLPANITLKQNLTKTHLKATFDQIKLNADIWRNICN